MLNRIKKKWSEWFDEKEATELEDYTQQPKTLGYIDRVQGIYYITDDNTVRLKAIDDLFHSLPKKNIYKYRIGGYKCKSGIMTARKI